MKMSKAHRFLTFRLSDDLKQVIIDSKGGRDSTWADFVKALPKSGPRYGIYDYKYTTDDKPPRELEKLIFVYWGPDSASVKDKTIYATNKESFKGKVACTKEYQATDISDLDEKYIAEGLKK